MLETIPVRPAFWNIPVWAQIGVYILGILAVALCVAAIIRAVRLRRGQAPNTGQPPLTRDHILYAITQSFIQKRITRTTSGKVHFVLFWGFIFLFLGTAIATIDWDVAYLIFGTRILQGNFYLIYKVCLEIAGLLVIAGIIYFAWRRFIAQDFRVEGSFRFAAILASLLFIVVTGFIIESLRLAIQQPAWSSFSFVAHNLIPLWAGMTPETIESLHLGLWIIHGICSLLFIAAIPLTFYAHMFKTPTSMALRKPKPIGAIDKIEDIEEQESFGISKFEQFTRTDRARIDGCTECGRCRAECPAVKAGTPLDPKNLVLSLKRRLQEPQTDEPLIDGTVSKDALWSCTTCGACANVCPAEIPLPDLIVSMRRHLALECGEFPDGLAQALENTATVGNPWGMDPGSRLKWASDLEVPIAKPGQSYDVIYWVGCSASYDRRAQKIARAMIKLLKASGTHFAVMQEERCHADWARRAGEEYLYQTAALENIENLNRYSFKHILAACPHCFNTLKNEYPAFEGGQWSVISHVEWIQQAIDSGALKVQRNDALNLTLHDACYLARYNKIGKEPRKILRIAAQNLVETPQRGCHAMCCGAGGAQIFMDQASRINSLRLKELVQTGADTIAVTCPHCLTMLTSAQAELPSEAPKQAIRDIAEIVADQLQ